MATIQNIQENLSFVLIGSPTSDVNHDEAATISAAKAQSAVETETTLGNIFSSTEGLLEEADSAVADLQKTLIKDSQDATRFVETALKHQEQSKTELDNPTPESKTTTRKPLSGLPEDFGSSRQLLVRNLTDKVNAISAELEQIGAEELEAANATKYKSFSEIWEDTTKAVKRLNEEYLKAYETVVERYTNFFRDFTNFMSGLTSHLQVTTDDKGNQTMKFNESVLKDLDALIKKYQDGQDGVLYPESGSTTKENAENWAKELGVDSKYVVASGSGYVVRMDISPLETIRKDLTESALKDMNTFQYQAWRSGFDAQSDIFKNTLQTLTTKYSNAHGNYDTLVKMLSSSINSALELLKFIFSS